MITVCFLCFSKAIVRLSSGVISTFRMMAREDIRIKLFVYNRVLVIELNNRNLWLKSSNGSAKKIGIEQMEVQAKNRKIRVQL